MVTKYGNMKMTGLLYRKISGKSLKPSGFNTLNMVIKNYSASFRHKKAFIYYFTGVNEG